MLVKCIEVLKGNCFNKECPHFSNHWLNVSCEEVVCSFKQLNVSCVEVLNNNEVQK